MKLKKYSSGLFNKNKNFKYSSNKNISNIQFNSPNTQIYLKLPCKKVSNKISLNKKSITTSNLNFKEKKIKFNYNNINNSHKSLISKSISDLRFKTDIALFNNSPNCSMNIFSNKSNKIEVNNKTKVKSLSKNFSSRNFFDRCGKSFEILKISNEEIYLNKNLKNNKFNDSFKASNKSHLFNLVKNKNSFNSVKKLNDNCYLKKKNYNKNNNKYNNLCGLLTKKNKQKNQISNFSALVDKYLYDSSYINIYQSDKENINTNNNPINKSKKNINKLLNINITTHKNKRNINNRSLYLDFHTKRTQPKHSSKHKINLPLHPNSKIIKHEKGNITDVNQYYSKSKINLTENIIQLDNKFLSKIKRQNSSKFLVPLNLKKKESHKIINDKYISEINYFSEKSYRKNKSKITKKNKSYTDITINENNQNVDSLDSYEGVEMGHFQIVKLIQKNKKKIIEKNK